MPSHEEPPETPRFGLVDALAMPVYDLGEGHPFARDRQEALFDLLARMQLVDDDQRMPAPEATRAELELAHDPEYIDMVAATSVEAPTSEVYEKALSFGLGTSDNPIAPNQHLAASRVAGATLDCVRQVISGKLKYAFNPTGGLHHAAHRAASGFCIYNDLVVGIRGARDAGLPRVLYVDFDVHHGDGVEFAFDQDPSVVTVSFHQSPETLFPGTGLVTDRGKGAGQGSVVNMPFAPHTDDESWWHCVETVLTATVRQFQPSLIVSQHGCDPHHEDPLAQLQLTTSPMRKAASLCRVLANEVCDGHWVATGGGGYQPLRVLPRAWTMVWTEMSGRELPTHLDRSWLDAWQHASELPLTPTFEDTPIEPSAESRTAAAANEQTLAILMKSLGC